VKSAFADIVEELEQGGGPTEVMTILDLDFGFWINSTVGAALVPARLA
jgi:hypothetical protein